MIKRVNAGYLLLGIILSIVLLLTAVEVVTFNENHYREMFDKYNIPKETGLEKEELIEIINDVLLYFKDDRQLLNTTRKVNGEIIPAFGERAILHMIDVKELFVSGKRLRNGGIIIALLLTAVLLKKDRFWKEKLSKTLISVAVVNVLLMLMLYILMRLDFYRYFTYFHLIFFTNDLWLLDPNTELLIKMLPEDFFNDTAVKIASVFFGSNLLLGIIGYKQFAFVNKLKKVFIKKK